ncbi:MAG: type II secretion system minor pseudopilin GspK [Tahibacter sp.]
MNRHQGGVALVIALLVVALATVLIAGLLDRGELGAARTRNLLRTQQADSYAIGLEAYAALVLQKDAESDGGSIDSSADLWAMPLPPTEVPGGMISASMRDMNGCFNVNNLAATDAASRALWRKRFENLLIALRLDPSLSAVVVDWLDRDGTPIDNGGEDGAYLALTPPYRVANSIFVDISELRLLRGFSKEVYAALEPNVCALPITSSALNVNTASVAVLMSLSPMITEQVARRLWQEGGAQWNDVNRFSADLAQQSVVLNPREEAGLDVKSQYFRARGKIELDGLVFLHDSILARSSSGVRVLRRNRGQQ